MQKRARSVVADRRAHALVFAALGDETRLALLARLGEGEPRSITQLTELTIGARITRQAVTKHLRVLERARLVRCVHAGRERVFELETKAVFDLGEYLTHVSQQWEGALFRLKAVAEADVRDL